MPRTIQASALIVLMTCAVASASAMLHARVGASDPSAERLSVLARAQVWEPTDIGARDLKAGPEGPGAFAFRETVSCTFVNKKSEGFSPKFYCRIGKDDEVKVKFGGANGEVFGEVLATRLLWALGFGADRMYPVNVICRGCSVELGGIERAGGESRFDPAVIERKMTGKEWPPEGKSGWSWRELDRVNPEVGGAPRAQVDALKLVAVFFQHTDSKPEQQRILCLGQAHRKSSTSCESPFLMINDLGLTFGRANRSNDNKVGGVNLDGWRHTPVWMNNTGCTGNLPKSLTGTLDNPVISEEGRSFLAGLLAQLSDGQIRDLFEVARVNLRLRSPENPSSGNATVEEWADAFKVKRQEIADRRCS